MKHRAVGALAATASILAMLATGTARAAEQPAGEPVEKNGLEINAVYLQPVEMEPAVHGQEAATSDIHLEADIHAAKNNKNGFAVDSWIPYLKITYMLAKKGGAWKASGVLLPMVAADGPHYGANIKLDGPGAYDLVFHIEPPSANGFMHHTDKETGVASWWEPFDYKGGFKFVGTGKKGKY